MQQLPPELIVEVMEHLDLASLKALNCTNQVLHGFVLQRFWRYVVFRFIPSNLSGNLSPHTPRYYTVVVPPIGYYSFPSYNLACIKVAYLELDYNQEYSGNVAKLDVLLARCTEKHVRVMFRSKYKPDWKPFRLPKNGVVSVAVCCVKPARQGPAKITIPDSVEKFVYKGVVETNWINMADSGLKELVLDGRSGGPSPVDINIRALAHTKLERLVVICHATNFALACPTAGPPLPLYKLKRLKLDITPCVNIAKVLETLGAPNIVSLALSNYQFYAPRVDGSAAASQVGASLCTKYPFLRQFTVRSSHETITRFLAAVATHPCIDTVGIDLGLTDRGFEQAVKFCSATHTIVMCVRVDQTTRLFQCMKYVLDSCRQVKTLWVMIRGSPSDRKLYQNQVYLTPAETMYDHLGVEIDCVWPTGLGDDLYQVDVWLLRAALT